MADHVLESQNIEGGDAEQFIVLSSRAADVLHPSGYGSIGYPMAREKGYIRPRDTVAFGEEMNLDIPNGYIEDVYLEVTLGALSSGNWCQYPGLSLIDELELSSSGSVLQEFRYAPVAHECLSRFPSKKVLEYLTLTGGTSFASGKVIVPLPLFWTKFGNPGSEHPTPLNTNNIDEKLRLNIKLRALSDLIASGATAGSPTISVRLYYYKSKINKEIENVHKEQAYTYKAHDFQTLPVDKSGSIATNTETTFNISAFKGSIDSLYFFNKLVSDIDTNNSYFLDQGDIDELELKMDGKSYWESDSKESLRYDKMNAAGIEGQTTTIGDPVCISFAYSHDPHHYTGALNTKKTTVLEAVLKHQAGANSYIEAMARMNVHYMIHNKAFVRIRGA